MSTEKKEAGIAFKLVNTNEKPPRTYKKGSKFDPILDTFIASGKKLVSVQTDKDGNYLRTQLVKRVTARKLDVLVSVVNGIPYLEVGKPKTREKKEKKEKKEPIK